VSEMIEKVGILGAGTMGRDIAQVCAMSGLNVALVDVSALALAQSISTLGSRFERHEAKMRTEALARRLAAACCNIANIRFAGCGRSGDRKR
jgi:3-hydroxybutyryl-CoA dehydrogenase